MEAPVVKRKRRKAIGTVRCITTIFADARRRPTLMHTLERGVSQVVFYYMGATSTAKTARVCLAMNTWCVIHQSLVLKLNFRNGYEIPRKLMKRYPRLHTVTTAQQDLSYSFNHMHFDRRKTTFFSWNTLRNIHLYKNRLFTAEEVVWFQVFTSLDELVIEADPHKPHETNPATPFINTEFCAHTKQYFNVHEIIATDLKTDLVFLKSLERAKSLRVLNIEGLSRAFNQLESFANDVTAAWPNLEVLSPLPYQAIAQITIISNMKRLAPATISNVSPLTINFCTRHILEALVSLTLRIPRSERPLLDTKPYIDIGEVIDKCTRLVSLTVREHVDKFNLRCDDPCWHRPMKPYVRLAPTLCDKQKHLRDVTIDNSGSLTLDDVGSLVLKCPNLEKISVVLTGDFPFLKRPGVPNGAERAILRILNAQVVVSVETTLRMRVPYSLRTKDCGELAALFFTGSV